MEPPVDAISFSYLAEEDCWITTYLPAKLEIALLDAGLVVRYVTRGGLGIYTVSGDEEVMLKVMNSTAGTWALWDST